jgi:hypothetical protein
LLDKKGKKIKHPNEEKSAIELKKENWLQEKV